MPGPGGHPGHLPGDPPTGAPAPAVGGGPTAAATDGLHHDDLPIDLPLVRALVDRDHPGLAALPLRRLRSPGSTNALYRLGDDLVVRLPRQPGGSVAIDTEAAWLPVVGPDLPVAVPEVVAVGRPGFGYPERWSLVRWLHGSTPPVPEADGGPGPPRTELAGDLAGLAGDLAGLVRALGRVAVPPGARADPALRGYRGGPLATRDATMREAIAACRAIDGLSLDLDGVERVWGEAMALPDAHRAPPPRWYHGDLTSENLLVRAGRLTAVLDFGELGIGDPTIDLTVAWEVLDPPARQVFHRALGVDGPTWLRARAWALTVAVVTLPYYWRTLPDRCARKVAVATAVLADDR